MNNPSFITNVYIDPPYRIDGWIGLILMVIILGWGIRKSWESSRNMSGRRWVILSILSVLTPLLALVFLYRLPVQEFYSIPGIPAQSEPPGINLLTAVPWVLASGFLAPVWAVVLAALSGLVIAFTETHHYFTPIEIACCALIFSFFVRQRYRTPIFQVLRHPAAAGLTLAVTFAPFLILTSFFASSGALVARIDYALTQTWLLMLARGGEIVLASILAEVVYLFRTKDWGRPGRLVPSPLETSIQWQFSFIMFPLFLILVLTLTIGDWVVAGNAASRLMQDRLENAAKIAANSLPQFLETGQTLNQSQSTPDLLALNGEALRTVLGQKLRTFRFFNQIFLFSAENKLLGGYPRDRADQLSLSNDEIAGLNLVSKGIFTQTYVSPPQNGEKSVIFSFITAILDSSGRIKGMVLARTDLQSNPLTQPAIQAIESLQLLQGEGEILNENQQVVYQSSGIGLLSKYENKLPNDNRFFNDKSKTGVRRLTYAHLVAGNHWRIIVSIPAEQAQVQALVIAIPLLVIMVVISIIAFLLLRIGLRRLTSGLQTLSAEASMMTQGKLDQPLSLTTVDEVGQVGRAFEQMRQSLKARLEESNALLKVSQAVASNLEAGEAIHPVLEAALLEDASCSRVVLPQDVMVDLQYDRPLVLGYGVASERYAYLDGQIFELMQHQDVMCIPNTSRIRRLNYAVGAARPGAVVAVAMHHENHYLGALWIAFDRPHNFSEEEIRFFGTLANQVALAASNARLYATAEIGRQRLEGVLVSSPEPVLVFDEKMRLLLLNSAALQVPGLLLNSTSGTVIQEVINHAQLLDLITHRSEEKMAAREITFSSGRIFFASVSIVTANNRLVGKVCVLQDVTHFKKLDSLKTEFVATVSHDLRSPMTLIRGYTTMLPMVGELNEQQKNYVQKIVIGVDNMSRLIINLLDLGKIEAGIGLQIERVVAQDVVEQVLSDLQPQAAQKNINLVTEISTPHPVLIEADRALLIQSVTNLIENAIKFTAMNGTVKVSLQVRAESVVFEVQDNGIGIAPLDLPRVFEKFYRSGRREIYQQRGTGLGLAIVKSIADRHGGQVWADSQLGRGSTFFLEIPFRHAKLKQILN